MGGADAGAVILFSQRRIHSRIKLSHPLTMNSVAEARALEDYDLGSRMVVGSRAAGRIYIWIACLSASRVSADSDDKIPARWCGR
jgi:hypothetical protein